MTGTLPLLSANSVPSISSVTGVFGELRVDGNYLYICIGTNNWRRVSISGW